MLRVTVCGILNLSCLAMCCVFWLPLALKCKVFGAIQRNWQKCFQAVVFIYRHTGHCIFWSSLTLSLPPWRYQQRWKPCDWQVQWTSSPVRRACHQETCLPALSWYLLLWRIFLSVNKQVFTVHYSLRQSNWKCVCQWSMRCNLIHPFQAPLLLTLSILLQN